MTGEQRKDRGGASVKLNSKRVCLGHLGLGTTLRYMAAVVLVKAPTVPAEALVSCLRVLRSPLLSFLLPQLLLSRDTALRADVDGVVFIANSVQVGFVVGVLVAVGRVVIEIWQVAGVVGIFILPILVVELVIDQRHCDLFLQLAGGLLRFASPKEELLEEVYVDEDPADDGYEYAVLGVSHDA